MKSMKFVLAFALLLFLVSSVSATAIGTTWNQSNSSPSAFSGYFDENYNPIATPDFNATEPWASMGRVNISNNTFVAVKRFYYRTENVTVGTSHWMNWSISMDPLPGYTVHDWFKVNTTEIPVQYIGAFEGSTFDVSCSTYVGDPTSIDITAGSGDKLVSVAGQKPTSGLGKATLTLPAFRTVAQNNGANNELQSFNGVSAIEMMYIIEYRNWDSQTVIGTGVTQITDDEATNMAIPTGLTAGFGANSTNCGNYTCSVPTVHYQTHQATNQISYRGYEGMYGNLWKWVDFINIKADRNPWIANYSAASDTFSGSYRNSGLTLAASNGYVSNLAHGSGLDYGYLASGVSGSASTYVTDYYYQASGHRAALFGGRWSDGLNCGPAYWSPDNPASSVHRSFGGRLAFTPPIYSNFTYTNTTPTVTFTDTSYNISTRTGLQTPPTSWNWSFGDGAISSSQNPSHTYTTTGTYTVNLTSGDGTNYDVKLQSVYVIVGSPNLQYKVGSSGVQINNQTPYVGTGTIRNVTSNTTRAIINMTWDTAYVKVDNIRINTSAVNITGLVIDSSSIGNGFAIVNMSKATGFTSPANALFDFNITYINYASPGTIALFGFDNETSKYYDPSNATYWNFAQINTANAVIGTWGPIVANFTANQTTVQQNQPVLFTDSSTGYPSAYAWTFGDGNTSTSQNPVYSYPDIGVYNVSLHSYLAANGTVTDTLTRTNYITVVSSSAPAASFTPIGETTGIDSKYVQFNDASSNTPTSWNWYYTGISVGNNTKTQFSTVQNATGTFGVGNFSIALNATNLAGTGMSAQSTWVNVSATPTLPTASFTANVTSGVAPLSVLFTDTSTGPTPFTYYWDFGDLTNSTSGTVAHTYSSSGIYTVNHSVTNLNGTAYAVDKTITVAAASGFNRVDLEMEEAYVLTVTFRDSVTGAPIPVVTVIDSNGYSQTTSTGIFTYSYPYGPVALYVSSAGYTGKTVSYYIDEDRDETVQLVQTITASTQSTWWTPHSVQITIFDTYGNPLDGVAINATYNESSMPTNWIQELYGIKESPATDMTNMSLIMTGTTGTDGSMTFTMLGSLKYDIYLTSSEHGLDAYHVSAYPSDSMLNIYVSTSSSIPIVRGNSTYSQLNGTRVYATEPDIGNVSMCIDYKDTSGLTTSVTDTWLFKNNNTVMNTTTFVPGTTLNTHCYTIRNVRGTQVWWGYNATRTGV